VQMSIKDRAEGARAPRWAVLVPWFLVATLVCANVATLVSVDFHSLGFRAVEKMLTALGGQVGESILHRSPTRVAAREREAFAKASAVVRNVAKRTTTRLAVHAAESVASVPARVLPFVGATAIVAMTASDVRSDCATVAEINEVLGALGAPAEDPSIVCKYASQVPSASEAWRSAKSGAGAVGAKVTEMAERFPSR
jgi:hypothetical protein